MGTKIIQRLSTITAVLLVIPLTIMALIACVSSESNANNIIKNGIYKYESELNFNSITYFVDESEVYSYFKTKDKNGVNLALKHMEFDKFLNSINSYENKEKYIELKDSFASSYVLENDKYKLVNAMEFEYNYDENKNEYTSAELNPIVKCDAKNNVVTLYFPFYIINDDETVEVTPIYVEAKLVLVEER